MRDIAILLPDAAEEGPRRDLGDGRSIWLRSMLFNLLLSIGPTDAQWFDDSWEYTDPARALVAFLSWDPATQVEPDGWYRHPRTGRRRPDGDASREYVQE